MIDPETLEVHQVIKFKYKGYVRYGVVLKTSDLFKTVTVRSKERNVIIHWRDTKLWEAAKHVGSWGSVSNSIAALCFTGKEIAKKLKKNRKQRRKG